MAGENITDISLTIKADKKTYFKTSHINPFAEDADLLEFAEAVNSVQNAVLDQVIKTVTYLLLPQV